MSTIMRESVSAAILRQLARQERRVFAGWRALILLRRATFELPDAGRRWRQLPREWSDIQPVVRQMERREEIEPIENLPGVYQVVVPYARSWFVQEDEILMEVHPYCAVTHLSALVFHGLTDQFPNALHAMAPADGRGGLLPADTHASDWEGIELPRGRRAERIMNHPVQWRRWRPERVFGLQEYRPRGYPVRVTTPERTLLDGLLEPSACGGIENVLLAWGRAASTLDVDDLVSMVDRFGVNVLRQRAGFIMDHMGLAHPGLKAWRGQTQRGGTSKMVAADPYSPHYDETWSISLNAPINVLRDPFG
ncbi:MAG: hypothetical protein M3462_07505 [Chloroflexota bacterium]|nr:hypothetical protein [Chloroflexota bacterium]